jgi:nickel/cobalt exporter
MDILIASTLAIAVLHSLAPDHWLPFVMLGRAQHWSRWKLTWITSLAGLGHVTSSLVIGAIGVLIGMAVEDVNLWESSRSSIASLLLIGFGVAYMVWGIKNWGRKHTHEMNTAKMVSYWTLFALVVFGPCEPLIPLIFVGYGFGWMAVFGVFVVFGTTTIAMMLVQVHLATVGMRLVRIHWLEHGSHAIAGAVIALTGVAIMVLGL